MRWLRWSIAAAIAANGVGAFGQDAPPSVAVLPTPRSVASTDAIPQGPAENPIDLGTALRLAHVDSPELLLARERVAEATAVRQLAAAQILPNLNAGTNYDMHRGVLQQASGNILNTHSDALYVGLGANAVGAGTVNIPGLNYNLNVGEAWYSYLARKQQVVTADRAAEAVRNDVLLRVCLAYLDLLSEPKADSQAIARQNKAEAAELSRITDAFAETGQGRKADADRARVELRRREADIAQAEGETSAAAARLAELLNLDPAMRLRPVEGWVVPIAVVPDAVTLPELLAIALLERPELAARRSEIRTSLYQLSLAKALPFSPNVILGFSVGDFGGGSNLISSPPGFVSGDGTRIEAPRFSSLEGRTDLDVVVFWTFRNLGVGNIAMVRAADSRVKQMRFRELETLNLVRAQVAEAHGWISSRASQIDAGEKAVRAAQDGYALDLARIRGGQGLPLEAIDSMRLLGRSRFEYLAAVVDYNRAQYQLWVALGRPPAEVLSRPAPADARGGPRLGFVPVP